MTLDQILTSLANGALDYSEQIAAYSVIVGASRAKDEQIALLKEQAKTQDREIQRLANIVSALKMLNEPGWD